MMGDKTLLKEVHMGKGGRITYGDGSQSKVIGKGIIDIPGLRDILGSSVCRGAQGKSSQH